MVKRKKELRFEELIRFPMPKRGGGRLKIIVSANGITYASPVIRKSIEKENEKMLADFRHSEDCKVIMIQPGGVESFRFTKNGRQKYREWPEMLKRLGYLLPATYFLEWSSEQGVWIGELQEVPEAPEI